MYKVLFVKPYELESKLNYYKENEYKLVQMLPLNYNGEITLVLIKETE